MANDVPEIHPSLDGLIESQRVPIDIPPEAFVASSINAPRTPPRKDRVVALASNASPQAACDGPGADVGDVTDFTGLDRTARSPSHEHQLDLAGGQQQPAAETTGELKKPSVPQVPFRSKYRRLPPIYLGPDRRQYANPISYIGGPRYDPNKRGSVASSQGDSITSLNSVMSLD
ncbi:hypothetical protein ZHAS_00019907 [Anopheles sinensis]|uniref:Uncharacterized protein n=1 Tax=Anopheles sinensis TaxID=74873 RepID=A0A084WMI4_ANOSI|nr:hypothetical protein ZHAS_00019907 [Anopheles sinensis]